MNFFSTVAFALKRNLVLYETPEDKVRNSWEYFWLQQSINNNPMAKRHLLVVSNATQLSSVAERTLCIDGFEITKTYTENNCVTGIHNGEFTRGSKLFVEVSQK